MLVQTALFSAALIAFHIQPSAAWWDNGHMLIGEVASQLMSIEDREIIEAVLNEWEDEFINTNRITTAAVWPDLIKCAKSSPFCGTPVLPSVTIMEEWHFIDLPINVNGTKFLGKDADLELFKFTLGGNAPAVLEKAFQTFATTRSIWAGNFMLRNFIHMMGDVHQPMHALGGLSAKFPKGDQGGNYYKFSQPCPFANLHALWDAAGGLYSNNWAPEMDFEDDLYFNATELALLSEQIDDPLKVESLIDLPYDQFSKEMVQNKLIQKIILTTYNKAEEGVYTKLDLTIDDKGTVKCPAPEYFEWAQEASRHQLAIAGRRLAVALTQFARQIRADPVI